ncbi:Maf family nucleotide pyrophosphatase [Bacteroidota bacterium]
MHKSLVLENLKDYRIILGSKSPRRKLLFEELGLQFEVMHMKDTVESFPDSLSKYEIPVYLAERKADLLMKYLSDNDLLITADTIVWYNNSVLGKPVNAVEAFQNLKLLSGNKHEVITGVCIQLKGKRISFYSQTYVYFSNLTNAEIQYYITHYRPFDKAGSYGIQEFIGYIGIEQIKGSYFNVMGLPIQKLYNELKKI